MKKLTNFNNNDLTDLAQCKQVHKNKLKHIQTRKNLLLPIYSVFELETLTLEVTSIKNMSHI